MDDKLLTTAQIEATVERGFKFLGTMSQVPSIRALMQRGGYTTEEHARGWELALELVGYKNPIEASGTQLKQRQAIAELDAYDGPSFDRARAALDRQYPAQSAYVFEGLTAKSGADAVGSVRTFVDRVAALRDGSDPKRSGTRADDAAAAALLGARQIIDASEETRLRGLIADATSLAEMPTPAEPDPTQRQVTARALDAWLRDWRETARVLVTRRDYQIRLGLAERRAPSGTASEPGSEG